MKVVPSRIDQLLCMTNGAYGILMMNMVLSITDKGIRLRKL